MSNHLWHAYSANSGTTWTWEDIGDNISSAPSVVSWGFGRLDIFVRGSNNAIHHRAFEAGSFGWGPWEDWGGTLASAPSAVSWGPGRLDAFVRFTDGYLWQLWWAGGSWNWNRITDGITGFAPVMVAAPAGISWGANRIDVFVRTTDNKLWQAWWPNGGNGWQWVDQGGILTSAPAVESWSSNRLDVFMRGAESPPPAGVFHKAFVPGWGP